MNDMTNGPVIIKSSGEIETFSRSKLERSIEAAGASTEFAREITDKILKTKKKFGSTNDVLNAVNEYLQKEYSPLAARYNLKSAVEQLGPTGFPFEKFVAEIFSRMGYHADSNKLVDGICVKHEMDMVLTDEKEKNYVEVKFHNKKWIKTDVRVILYVRARVDDILDRLAVEDSTSLSELKKSKKAWVITNTEFTSDAWAYGDCKNMRLISWTRPRDQSIHDLINNLGLHPVTCLTVLNNKQKATLTDHGVTLCRDIKKQLGVLKDLGMDKKKIAEVLREAEAIHLMKNTRDAINLNELKVR